MKITPKNSGSPGRLKRVLIREEIVEICDNQFIPAVILGQLMYWAERVNDVDDWLEEEAARIEQTVFNPQEARDMARDVRTHKSDAGWIYKSASQLNDECMLGMSVQTILRHMQFLLDREFIERRENTISRTMRTYEYRVNLTMIAATLYEHGYHLEGYSYSFVANLFRQSGQKVFQNGTDPFQNTPGTAQNGTDPFQNGHSYTETKETTAESTVEKVRQRTTGTVQVQRKKKGTGTVQKQKEIHLQDGTGTSPPVTVKTKQGKLQLSQSILQAKSTSQDDTGVVSRVRTEDPAFDAWWRVQKIFAEKDPDRAKRFKNRMGYDEKAIVALEQLNDLGYDIESYIDFYLVKTAEIRSRGKSWAFSWGGFATFYGEYGDALEDGKWRAPATRSETIDVRAAARELHARSRTGKSS